MLRIRDDVPGIIPIAKSLVRLAGWKVHPTFKRLGHLSRQLLWLLAPHAMVSPKSAVFEHSFILQVRAYGPGANLSLLELTGINRLARPWDYNRNSGSLRCSEESFGRLGPVMRSKDKGTPMNGKYQPSLNVPMSDNRLFGIHVHMRRCRCVRTNRHQSNVKRAESFAYIGQAGKQSAIAAEEDTMLRTNERPGSPESGKTIKRAST